MTQLLQLRSQLHTLKVKRGFVVFPTVGLPSFSLLTHLRLVDQAFVSIAPLLCHAPTLQTLVLRSVRDLLPHHACAGTNIAVSDLVRPTFSLWTLDMSLTYISPSDLAWPLASFVHSLRNMVISALSQKAAGVCLATPTSATNYQQFLVRMSPLCASWIATRTPTYARRTSLKSCDTGRCSLHCASREIPV